MNPRPLTDDERAQLHAVFLTLRGLHEHFTFDQALAEPVILGCMRNVNDARQKRLAQARARAAREAAEFQLT